MDLLYVHAQSCNTQNYQVMCIYTYVQLQYNVTSNFTVRSYYSSYSRAKID